MASATAPSQMLDVRVGDGRKAHVFKPNLGANAKILALKDGGTAYDYVLCGASGALRMVEGLERCRTCESLLEQT